LCEQVIGRGLRRVKYYHDEQGYARAEYVNVFGVVAAAPATNRIVALAAGTFDAAEWRDTEHAICKADGGLVLRAAVGRVASVISRSL
jgi:hypothetical protein